MGYFGAGKAEQISLWVAARRMGSLNAGFSVSWDTSQALPTRSVAMETDTARARKEPICSPITLGTMTRVALFR